MAIAARRPSRAVVLLLVGSMFVLCSPSSPVAAISCAELRAWAEPLAGTSPTLDELLRYDRPHRGAYFAVLSPEAQASVWRQHLERLSERPELSPTQRALVREAIGLHTAALYQHEAKARQAYDDFWKRATAEFQDAFSQRAWRDLGAFSGNTLSRLTGQTYCECMLGGGTGQCGGVSCLTGACTRGNGCGPSGLEICDGMCNW